MQIVVLYGTKMLFRALSHFLKTSTILEMLLYFYALRIVYLRRKHDSLRFIVSYKDVIRLVLATQDVDIARTFFCKPENMKLCPHASYRICFCT